MYNGLEGPLWKVTFVQIPEGGKEENGNKQNPGGRAHLQALHTFAELVKNTYFLLKF